jgi:Putative peptidoglycan binding domain
LREVLAAANHDFVLTEPASQLKRLREKLLTASRRGSRRGRRYLRILGIGFLIATVATILLNALIWQRTRHPAPLFSRAAPAAPIKQPMIARLIEVPLPRPQPAVAPIQAQGTPVEKPAAQKSQIERSPLDMPARGDPRQARITSSPPYDGISQLLKASPEPTARTIKAATSAAPSKMVLAAQRALIRLGFVLNADGVAGPTTRQAIGRYERDRGIPVRREVTRALMRQLSAETGSPIN